MTATSTTAHRICPFCEAACGLEVDVDQNKVVRIRADDQDVSIQGHGVSPPGRR